MKIEIQNYQKRNFILKDISDTKVFNNKVTLIELKYYFALAYSD